jgi:hypothetical protein|nr:MAG TPA: hypothetical protein [Caudoviricetes sp.]
MLLTRLATLKKCYEAGALKEKLSFDEAIEIAECYYHTLKAYDKGLPMWSFVRNFMSWAYDGHKLYDFIVFQELVSRYHGVYGEDNDGWDFDRWLMGLTQEQVTSYWESIDHMMKFATITKLVPK